MRAAAAVAAALVAAVVVLVLSQSEQRLADTNARVLESGVKLRIKAGKRRCQKQDVPAGAAVARVSVDPSPHMSGPLAVAVEKDGRPVSRGETVGFGGKPVDLGLEPKLKKEIIDARVCLVNPGTIPIALDGNLTPPTDSTLRPLFDGQQVPPDDVRVDFLREGSESWWSLAPVVADRLALRKASFFGAWTMWAVFALVALTWVAGLLLLLREARSP